MAHDSKIQDTETHFIIDPTTRTITNGFVGNNIIVQHDHNSERFTFEIPRYVDGHDMSECTEVRVNYRNSASSGLSKTESVYICDDLAISDKDENTVTFSWLLSSATTQYIGFLYFSVVFICLDGATIDYAWNTGIYKDITIIESINNSEEVVTDNVDAIASLREELKSEIEDAVSDLPTGDGDGSGLPEVTAADNGKIPMVVGGKWENVQFPAGAQYFVQNVVVPADAWNDNGSMIHAVVYDFDKSLEGCFVGVAISASATKEEIIEATRCGVKARTAEGTEVVLEALWAIPTIALPFDFIITKPTTLSYSVDDESMTLTIVEGGNDE